MSSPATPIPPGDEDEARETLARIVEALTAVLPTHAPDANYIVASRWNGVVEIEEFAFHSGVIRPDGSVGIFRHTWESGVADRYRTLIHEALHSFSPPYSLRAYRDHTGWEEGVVEALQRLLRQEVLGRIGVEIRESEFTEGDRRHLYNPYIETLEALRRAVERNAPPFYVRLLLTPLEQRLNLVRDTGRASLDPPHRDAFTTTLMLANARLRRPLHGF